MQFSEILDDTFPLSGGLLCGKLQELFLLAGVVFHRVFSIVLMGVAGLRNSEQLMRLQAESPSRVSKTVLQRQLGIALPLRPIHWLEKKLLKIEVSKEPWLRTGLGKNKF